MWDGYPEESNAPYGLAKKMMLVLSDAYRRQYGFNSCAPIIANLYGPNDDSELEDSHVIAAMIRKYVEAKDRGEQTVTLWGTGSPSREFLYVDDGARALVLAAEPPGGVRSGQRGRRGRDQDPRPRRDDLAARGLRGRDGVGRLASRRPAQALPRRAPRP